MSALPQQGRGKYMIRMLELCTPLLTAVLFSATAMAAVSEQTRTSIDRTLGHNGTDILEEGVYKILLPRAEATVVQDYQTLSPNLGLNSWATFSSGVHHEAIRQSTLKCPALPLEGAITAGPLDEILSMKETVTAGVYKAGIGTRMLLNGELIGREMGMDTWE